MHPLPSVTPKNKQKPSIGWKRPKITSRDWVSQLGQAGRMSYLSSHTFVVSPPDRVVRSRAMTEVVALFWALTFATCRSCEVVYLLTSTRGFMRPIYYFFTFFRDDINRAYRKLAILIHPDKSLAPGTEEAFKALVNARSALLQSNR